MSATDTRLGSLEALVGTQVDALVRCGIDTPRKLARLESETGGRVAASLGKAVIPDDARRALAQMAEDGLLTRLAGDPNVRIHAIGRLYFGSRPHAAPASRS